MNEHEINMSDAEHEYEKNFNLLLKDFLLLFHDFQIIYGYLQGEGVDDEEIENHALELYEKWSKPTIRMIETFSKGNTNANE